ncbi:LysR substrate-binding domain-containing protein [Pseudoxanthomonas winnipegensis]|uniref:LysR family transcriptional regulator n=1 Tax=Pseudoxanthomonas winnipegensis TaxID=2480810 RepID=UPI003F83BFE0
MNESTTLAPAQLRALRSFAAAARTLNFSRAAREVGCTPSVLSRRIAALEESAGIPLFLRTTRRMALTEHGVRLLAQYQRLEAALADMALALQSRSRGASGHLRLQVPASYGRYRLAPLLADFMRAHPGIALDVAYDDAFVDLVAGKVDLAVRVGRLDDARLVARRVSTMHRYLCASPDYLANAPELLEPSDLRAHRCIAFDGLRTGTLWQFHRQRQRRSVRIAPVMTCNDAQAARDAALAGVGIALQADYMSDALVAQGRLVPVLTDWPVSDSPVHLLWLPGADRQPALRLLIDALVAAMAD